jgi:succinate dehydrogenase hydrophobic anchor subunit
MPLCSTDERNHSRFVYNLQDINVKYSIFLTITLIPFKFKIQNGSYENVFFFFLYASSYFFGLVAFFGLYMMLLHQQVCMKNLALHGVHTHNNDVRGVRSVGRAQRSFVGARVFWVCVVA